ncbi:MAG: bifunctional 4-hydroxy-3-methylbut-2-enyl diphosphate reductase/30S ribosomal protein S1 [Clostridia bacterium]|nr:bifunctional 4-hydroxy-3-methylbut-2-enyl diphosphate reductase/30S ribosomal protein S1 [Clostridia bacterium]
MAEIIKSKYIGFCFGVKEAIRKAEQLAEAKDENEIIYTFGPLIHNQAVISELEDIGVKSVESLEGLEGATCIIRSHGQTKDFYEKAKTCNIKLVDATCPFVAKIHKLVEKAYEDGKQIIIIGDKNHPEVIGINGWCENSAFIVNSAEDLADFESDKELFVVCQTTIKKDLADEINNELLKKNMKFEFSNTICNATSDRQKDCQKLATKCDAMLVLGDSHSSNTKKLYEIASKACENTFFVENIDDIPLKKMSKYSKIGIVTGASTPESIITEVIAKMSEIITEEKNLMMEFMDEIEKSLRLPRTGEIVNGTVHQVTDKEVIVNLGCKKDGIIPKTEITLEGDKELTDLFKVGDEIKAKVIKTDDGDGGILLSTKSLAVLENWDELAKANENNETITVTVVRKVERDGKDIGVIAAYKEVNGYIPLSQLSNKYIEDAGEYVGKDLEVKIIKLDQTRNRVNFSHKVILNEERKQQLEAIWNAINVDDIVEGTVMRFTDYGAFVDIGGIDGLLHISEISWGKLKHPKEVLELGEKVQVKILSINKEKGKISLGLKQIKPEPWTVINDNYKVGQVITGKVVQIKEYGAFVELEPGLDGLVHISEVARKRVEKISDELQLGQEIQAVVLDIDEEKKRISLSIKATLPEEAPAEETVEEAPVEEAPVAAEETVEE